MKPYKVFSILFLSIFLMNLVSSATIYAEYTGYTINKTINNGDSQDFNVHIGSPSDSFDLAIEVVNSTGEVIYTYLDTKILSHEYFSSFEINSTVYGNEGYYQILVSVKDEYGEVTNINEILKLRVGEIDTTAPVIILNGENPQTIIRGNDYEELGAIATDDFDGELTSNIISLGSVDVNIIGRYTINYSVTDSAGNSATATRIINVVNSETIKNLKIESINDDSINEKKNYEYQVGVEYYGDGELTYLINGANWLEIDNKGFISGTSPSVSKDKHYEITITVSNETHSDSEKYILTVKNKDSTSSSYSGSDLVLEEDEELSVERDKLPSRLLNATSMDSDENEDFEEDFFYVLITTALVGITAVSLGLIQRLRVLRIKK